MRTVTKLCLSFAFLFALSASPALAAAPTKNTKLSPANNSPKAEGEVSSPTSSTTSEPAQMSSVSAERTSRFQLSLELLGAGLLYSFSGSYFLTDNVALNGGISYFTLSSTSSGLSYSRSASVVQLPLSASFLLGGPDHFFEVLGGGDIIFASASVRGDGVADKASASGFIPEIGAGYRYWPAKGGFHFRATIYGLAIPSNFSIWPGFSFGAAF